jgi:hypothetical protein
MMADELRINEYTVYQIVMQDLNIRKLCAEMVLKNLNDDRKARRNEALAEMLNGSKLNQIVLIRS